MIRSDNATNRRMECVTIGSNQLRDDMDGNIPPAPITVQVISSETEWDRLETEWNDLFGSVPTASPPQHFDWLRTWWHIYGSRYAKSDDLRILIFRRAERLVGILPLYLQTMGLSSFRIRCLRFLSTGEIQEEETCPDYLDLLCSPGEVLLCAEAARSTIAALDWDRLELVDLPEHSSLLHQNLGTSKPSGTCAVADLEGGFEQYLQRISSKNRQGGRRMLREMDKGHARFELATASQMDEFFADLSRLHQERWTSEGKVGCFVSSRFNAFHRALIAKWLPLGMAVIARLSLPSHPVSLVYGFIAGHTFHFYQSGLTTGDHGHFSSPGNLTNLLLMRELASRGVLRYDYLKGTALHKQRFTTNENQLVRIECWRSTLRATAYRTARSAVGTVKRQFQGQRDSQPSQPS